LGYGGKPRNNPAAVKDPTYGARYRAFLQKLRSARHEAGLSQVEVARKLRRPQSFISKIETGERRVDVIELLDLAQLYRKPLTYFVS
jgi:transcriptional regulator with XRE-family HTH domain